MCSEAWGKELWPAFVGRFFFGWSRVAVGIFNGSKGSEFRTSGVKLFLVQVLVVLPSFAGVLHYFLIQPVRGPIVENSVMDSFSRVNKSSNRGTYLFSVVDDTKGMP
jgi:hypothetical protein